MTAAREAIVLPVLLLTVALLGGLTPGGPGLLIAPSLFALVLGVLLVGLLVQSGTFEPLRVMNGGRATLANLNGIALLLALLFASAQLFTLLTPASGLPRVVFSVFFLILLLSIGAAAPDRVRLLRSLAVTFGAALVLKFVVLDALSSPADGGLARALQLLLDGMTWGALTQDAQHAASGYIAFAAIGLYLLALTLLPGRMRERLDTPGLAITRGSAG